MQNSHETVRRGGNDRRRTIDKREEEVATGEDLVAYSGDDEEKIHLDKNRILIGCSGSADTAMLPTLLEELSELKYNIQAQVVVTNNASHFVDRSCLPVRVHCDIDEWQLWSNRSDPVLHIELRKWADLIVVAPLDANTLAKIANGICDNLLTCVVRAWDLEKPVLFAPSMSKMMWHHPITASHINTLKSYGYEEIPWIDKAVNCDDGGMAKLSTIIRRILKNLERINGLTRSESTLNQWTSDNLSPF